MKRLSGYATPEGTAKYAERATREKMIPEFHFRKFRDLTLSSLGVGTYLGGLERQVDDEMERAIRESLLSGAMNVVDTAVNYRFQKSERCIARALSSLVEKGEISRSEIFISSKNGYLAPDADYERGAQKYIPDELLAKGIISTEDIVDSSHCMTIPFLKHELERSLKNLGLDTLDLIYLHNSAESQILVTGKEEYLESLRKAFRFYETARSEGKIRYYGMATWDCFRNEPDSADPLELEGVISLAEEVGGIDHGFRFIQFPYNLIMREALVRKNQQLNRKPATLLQVCEYYGIGVFTSVPLLQGRLARHGATPNLDGLTRAQSSLQFVRSTKGIIAPLVGHKMQEHIQENIAVSQRQPLSEEEFARVFKQ
ncbi:MAG: aldo/keto reductase [Nitrososphaerota archaeon]|nr:aldo/keto reductase [Nitrososphaerota archaeon]